MSDEYTLEVVLADMPRGWACAAIGPSKPYIAPPPVHEEIQAVMDAVAWIINDAGYKPPEMVGEVAERWIHKLRQAKGLPCA